MTYPIGERDLVKQAASKEQMALDSFGSRIHVRWSPDEAVTPLGLLPFRSIREAYCYAIICLHYMRRLYLHWCVIFYPNHKVLCIFQCYGVMSGNTPRE